MKLRWMLTMTLTASLLLPTLANAATVSPSPLHYQFEWASGSASTTGKVIIKGGISYIEAENLIEPSGLKMTWDSRHTRAEFEGINKKFAVRIGSATGTLDGKFANVSGKPFLQGNRLYVPARFMVEALEGTTLDWNKSTNVVTARGLHYYSVVPSRKASQTYGGQIYSVEYDTGIVSVTDSKGNSRKLASLGGPLYDYVTIDFEYTAGGFLILSIYDNYGEPHIHNTLFTVVLKNGGVIRQTRAHYYQRYSKNVTVYDGHLALTDGKMLRIVEDGTGNVVETIDLVKLGGMDDNYFVEGIDEDFILFRANMKGILNLYDRKTGKIVELYKQLLDADNQEYAETNDVPYHGDGLVFLRRNEDTLTFRNEALIVHDTKIYEYALSE
jgi:hypothetical protein